MLMGLLEPTSGTATIAGLDLRRDLRAIHTVMGVCPQFDVLWNELTAREHLRFYGRCGICVKFVWNTCRDPVPPKHMPKHRQPQAQGGPGRCTGSCHHRGAPLRQAAAQGRRPRGRIQRRHEAPAQRRHQPHWYQYILWKLINKNDKQTAPSGDPAVVFYDEPSTGLDPASRRALWATIRQAKPGRGMILTTHSMEEAAVLCDRIGVFVGGALVMVGPPKQLVHKYGGWYTLSVTTRPVQAARLVGLVMAALPDARLTYALQGSQRFEVPTKGATLSQVGRNRVLLRDCLFTLYTVVCAGRCVASRGGRAGLGHFQRDARRRVCAPVQWCNLSVKRFN